MKNKAIMPSFSAVLVVIAAAALSSVGAAPEPIGMPGCDTTCGDVAVPYPFGMGPARCYHSPGFNLTCDRTRLLLGDGTLRVVEINLYRSTVRAMHAGSVEIDAADGHGTFALGADGPCTLAAADRNELILTGCSVQATVRTKGNITIGTCSSFCVDDDDRLDDPDNQFDEPNLLDKSMQHCSGSRCCQANIVISHELELASSSSSYGGDVQVQLQWLGLNRSKDQQQGPARVFIAEQGWSGQSRVHHQLLQTAEETEDALMEVPVMLEWEVAVAAHQNARSSNDSTTCPTDIARNLCKSNHSRCAKGRRGGYTCRCDTYNGYDGNPYIPDGCKDVDECKQAELYSCYGECTNTDGLYSCRCPRGTYGDPTMPNSCISPVTAGLNCTRSCGDMNVPYPFGIGPPHCYLPGFNLTCDGDGDDDTSGHPRLLLRGFRVANISLENTTVRLVLVHGPVLYYPESDRFPSNTGEYGWVLNDVVGGSEPYSLSTLNELILKGCNAQVMLTGDGDPASDNSTNIISGCATFCSGNDTGVVGRVAGISGRGGKHCYGSGCCQARISRDSLPSQIYFKRLDTKAFGDDTRLPASVFIAEEGWFDGVASTAAKEVPLVLRWEVLQPGSAPANRSSHPPENCPAEVAGRICKSDHSHCIPGFRGYSCQCSESYHGNPYVDDGCTGGPEKPFRGLSIVIGVASGTGLVLLVIAAFFISRKIKHRRAHQIKRKFFKQNRGQLLQQLVSQRADIAERMIIPLEELKKATNNFDKDRELGGGGHGVVYKGILSDLHVVAIKKPKKVDQREIDEFINEVAILSQINHRNVVKLYGCCLETEVPMLVYEFISNGSLYEHLHVEGPRSLPWDDRLRIANEAAKSLAYLHSTALVPIIHRDIKSANILLDDTLTAKVADFGASRYISVEKSGLTTMVQGTIGYLDPMYSTTGRITEKSDVYSYGVILIELMTRTKPFLYIASQGEGLAAHFATLFKGGNLSQILDPQVIDEGGKEVEEVAALAVACVKQRGEDRPTMRQVELTLAGLRSSNKHVQENSVVNEFEENGIAISCTSTMSRRNIDESIRRYSMEEEFMLSARYPR